MGSDRFQIRPERSGESPRVSPEKPEFPGRRSFFAVLIGLGAAVIGALLGIPLIRFTIYPLMTKTTRTDWFKLGPAGDFASLIKPVRRTVKITAADGWRETISEKPVYITKGSRPGSEADLEVLSSICPHLGCEVPWNADRSQFVCPCHNSVFAADGSFVSGPSPRGMDTLPIKMENGELMVQFEYFRQLVPDKEVMG